MNWRKVYFIIERVWAEIFGEVAGRLVKPDGMQPAGGDMRLDLVPEGDHEVFRRGDDAAEKIDLVVQVAMVALVHDDPVQDALQLAEIHDVACLGIGLAAQGNLQHVVVAVPVGVGAEPVAGDVPALAFRGIVEPVGGVEVNLPRDDHRALLGAHGGWDGFGLRGFLRHGRIIR